jgi:hypothetical protein
MLKHIHDMTMVQPMRLSSFRRLFVGESIAVLGAASRTVRSFQ